MIQATVREGTWCDVDPGGVLVYVAPDGVVICAGRWAIPEPQPRSLYLRCGVRGADVLAVLQGHDDGHCLVTVNGQPWEDYGPTFGQNPFLVAATDYGWALYVMTSNRSYDLISLTPDGQWIGKITQRCEPTSQGFLDWRDGPIFTDAGRMANGLVQPNVAGELWVGQFPDREALAGHWRGNTFTIAEGAAFEPRVALQADGTWTACARSLNNRFLYAELSAPFVADAPVPPPPTPEPPPPAPPPEPPPMNTDYRDFVWTACDFDRCDPAVAAWPITTRLTDAYLALGLPQAEFPWRNPGWPEFAEPGVGGGLVGNVGIVAKIGGRWCVATFDWLRYPDQGSKGEGAQSIVRDQIRSGRWNDWQPQEGEVIGLFVATPCRGEARTVNQRSAIAWTRIGRTGIVAHEDAGSGPGGPTPVPTPDDPTPPTSPVDLTPIVEALETLQAGLADLRDWSAMTTATLDQIAGALQGERETTEAVLHDLHALIQATQAQIGAKRPVRMTGKLLGQAIVFSGEVG